MAEPAELQPLDRLVRDAEHILRQAEVPSARTDAELLAAHVLGLSRGELSVKLLTGLPVPVLEAERLSALVAERARRVPLQHLTGTAPFRNLELRVGPGVFIPRPETETVVELVLERLRMLADHGVESPRVVDLGTGSGAIAAATAAEFPAAEVHALELSEEAASWAELNFSALPPGSAEVTLHRGDLREAPELLGALTGSFDLVVSNPPYIPGDMVPAEVEVREHDPELALYGGGEGGLELPFAVVAVAERLLRPGGWLVMEHAEVQAGQIAAHCRSRPLLTQVGTHQDLSGRDRATSAARAASAQDGDGAGDGGMAQWRA